MSKRIGIYAGTFDPVHAGHITFALQAIKTAKLDKVFFLPERKPRYKIGSEHFGHRVAMLKRAAKPHPKLSVMELVDISFSVEKTLPRLSQRFGESQLIFLFGSDVIYDLPSWPKAAKLLASSELVVGLRHLDNANGIQNVIAKWPNQPVELTILESFAPDISSRQVRAALRKRQPTSGLLSSVERYSNSHWLYVSVA